VEQPGLAGAGWKKELTSGAHASARGEREGTENEMRESKKKTSSVKYAKGMRGPRAERPSGLGGGVGLGWLAGQGQRSGRAGWAGKEKKKEIH
jgi:hypothetical protein